MVNVFTHFTICGILAVCCRSLVQDIKDLFTRIDVLLEFVFLENSRQYVKNLVKLDKRYHKVIL